MKDSTFFFGGVAAGVVLAILSVVGAIVYFELKNRKDFREVMATCEDDEGNEGDEELGR